MGESSGMGDDRLSLGGVMGSIVLFILISIAWAAMGLDDYLSDEFSPLAVVLFVVFLGGALYFEYQKEQGREKEGNVHHWFSKETHELWNSKDTKGKIVYVLGHVLAAIIAVVLAWYALLFSAGWFFSQVP